MTRLIALALLFALAPAAVAFAQCCDEASAAADCCHQISQMVLEMKCEPVCLVAYHKPFVPYTPCASYCPPEKCHKPMDTYVPCNSICVVSKCHKPATAVQICGNCPADIELSGCRCAEQVQACATECAGCTGGG